MRVNRKKRAELTFALAAALVLMLMASGNDSWAAPLSGSEVRHSSGIALLGPLDHSRLLAQWRMSERLDRAYNGARILAEQNPAAFGYPWQESAAEVVVVRVATAEGEALARRWMAVGLEQTIPKPGGPVVMDIAPPETAVRLETVDRTIEQLERIQHAVGPDLAAIPGTDRIFQSGPDAENNRVVFSTDRINDAMLHALAARFGTEALAVRIERNPWTRPPGAPLVETDSLSGPVIAVAVVASGALLLGLTVLALRRRRL